MTLKHSGGQLPVGPEIHITPLALARVLGGVVGVLVLIHVLLQAARFMTGNERLFGLVYLFSLGEDGNVPTLYSGFALLFAALMLVAIAGRASRDRGYWWVLALAFLFLALDEMLELHEQLIEPLRRLLGTSGALHYAWVIPYGIGAGLFALAYLRFLARLPRAIALRMVLAGSIYVSGAIGFEMVGGLLAEQGGTRTPGYVLVQSIEEILEMAGIVLFIHVLADYLCEHLGGLRLRLAAARQRSSVR